MSGRLRERIGEERLLVLPGAANALTAVNVSHSVRILERAGASALQLEDQTFPKRCGHFSGKSVIPRDEMVQKIHAAVDTRVSEDLLIIARTDAQVSIR